jgi:hypothetical protein
MSYFDSMRETIENQLSKRIDRKHGDVFLRADFADLGGYDQSAAPCTNSSDTGDC